MKLLILNIIINYPVQGRWFSIVKPSALNIAESFSLRVMSTETVTVDILRNSNFFIGTTGKNMHLFAVSHQQPQWGAQLHSSIFPI